MKITNVDVVELEIPVSHGLNEKVPNGFFGARRGSAGLEFCLVKVETDNGLVGWGEAFAYQCRRAVAEAVKHIVAPRVIGRDPHDVVQINYSLQQELHLFGRYGITIFAIGGLDIALWDIVGKQANQPIFKLLGATGTRQIEAYSSLWRYGNREIVAQQAQKSIDLGYRYLKLHEITIPEVEVAREVLGDGFPIMLDTNCPWTRIQAMRMTRLLSKYDIYWLEEPINPPEDFFGLAELRKKTGVCVASGENVCTAFQFGHMLEKNAVDYAQPSVTKVGGITEFRKVAVLCDSYGVQIMPHSPYFGPGFLATLHLAQALPNPGLMERLFVEPEAQLYSDEFVSPKEGFFVAPQNSGLGADPDLDVIKNYQV